MFEAVITGRVESQPSVQPVAFSLPHHLDQHGAMIEAEPGAQNLIKYFGDPGVREHATDGPHQGLAKPSGFRVNPAFPLDPLRTCEV